MTFPNPPIDKFYGGISYLNMKAMNSFVLAHVKQVEMMGVIMRIISFSVVSWLGSNSPFLFVWIFNTTDAIILSWCALLRKDLAYSILNLFWILVGLVGIARAASFF